MNAVQNRIAGILLGAALFLGGMAVGGWRAPGVAAQSKPEASKAGQPKSVIHVVVYKWKDGVADADRQKILDGVREMGAQISGMKNVWLKTQRNQLKDHDGVFAIEFASPEAAAAYAEHPVHDAWSKRWLKLRQASLSFQVTNP